MEQARFLTSDADVWSQNAWDHVPPPDDQHEIISSALAKQKLSPVPEEEKQKYNGKPARHWYDDTHTYLSGTIQLTFAYYDPRDNFYKMNANNFFKNRQWYVSSY